jgi:hypothetical protein
MRTLQQRLIRREYIVVSKKSDVGNVRLLLCR